MSQYNDGPEKSYKAAGAPGGIHLRHKIDADGRVSVAGVGDQDIGTNTREVFAADEPMSVRSINTPTSKMVAAGAITAGSKVYTAATGKVNDVLAAGSFLRGIAVEDAAADGDIIEVVNLHGDTANP